MYEVMYVVMYMVIQSNVHDYVQDHGYVLGHGRFQSPGNSHGKRSWFCHRCSHNSWPWII